MKPPAILLLGILIFATTTILTNGTAHINHSSVGRKTNKNPNITLQTAANSIVWNGRKKQPISLHREGDGATPFTAIQFLGTYPGEIIRIEEIKTHYGERLLYIGQDFIAINGTDYIYYGSGSSDYWCSVGDVDMDGYDEVAVVDGDYLVLLNDRLEVIWRRWLGGFAGDVDSVFLANFTSPNYMLIATYKYNGTVVAFWNYTGEYVWHDDSLKARLHIVYYGWNCLDHYFSYDPDHGRIYEFIAFREGSGWDFSLAYFPYPVMVNNSIHVFLAEPFGSRIALVDYRGVAKIVLYVDDIREWDFQYAGRKLVAYDVDGDGDTDWLVYNGSFLYLIENIGNQSSTVRYRVLPDIDDYSMLPGYVVYLKDGEIHYLPYDVMVETTTHSVRDPKTSHIDIIFGNTYCYGPREIIRLYGPTNIEYLDYNFGWRYTHKDTHIVLYNLYHVIDIYPTRTITYDFTQPVYAAIATTNCIVVLLNDSGKVYYFGLSAEFSTNFSGIADMIVAADDNIANNYLYFMLNNTTVITFDFVNDEVVDRWTPTISGSKIVVDVYYRNYHLYSSVIGYTDTKATMFVFEDNNTIVSNSTESYNSFYYALGSMCMWDYDDDNWYEIAYAFFCCYYKSIGLVGYYDAYKFVVYDGSCVYGYSSYVHHNEPGTRISIHNKYSARPFYDGFVFFAFGGKFIIYHPTGEAEEITLDGRAVYAYNAMLATKEQVRIYSDLGAHIYNISENLRIFTVEKGRFTKALCLTEGYKLINITGSEDMQAPTVSINKPYDGEIINSYTIEVSWEASDDIGIASTMLRLDDGDWMDVSGRTSYTLHNVYEGNHTITVRVTDLVGKSSEDTVNITVVPPFTLSVYCGDNNSLINRSWVVVEYNTTGVVDSVSVLVNGSEKFSTTTMLNGSVNITGLTSGYWIVEVVASGSGVNVSYPVCVHVDIDAPVIRVISPENNTSFTSATSIIIIHIELKVWDNFGVDYFEYNINGSGWVRTNSSELDITLFKDGVYVVDFRVYDIAGNANGTRLVFSVDFPASFTVYFAYDNIWINKTTVSFSWESEHIDEVYLYVNGEHKTSLAPSGTYNLTLSEGIWNITLVAVGYGDRIVRAFWVKIDLTPPTINVLSPSNNSVINATGDYAEILIVYSVQDNVGVDRILIAYGNTTQEVSGNISIILPTGNHTIYITAIDRAGNARTVSLNIEISKSMAGGTEAVGGEQGGETETGAGTGTTTPEGIDIPLVATLILVSVAGLLIYVKKKR